MGMKSAMQELKEKMSNIGFTNVDEFINPYLEKEKQQIIEAYSDGWKNPSKYREHGSVHYYENTFNTTNKETLK